MQSVQPNKRRSHFDTTLHIYGLQRKQLEEIKISFVVSRKDWSQFRNDLENYGAFKEFDHFGVVGQPIRWFGPVRGFILARGEIEANDDLIGYVEAHPAFQDQSELVMQARQGLALRKNNSLATG